MDAGYLPLYLQGYGILSILLPEIWDSVFDIFVYFRGYGVFMKLIMGIFASL